MSGRARGAHLELRDLDARLQDEVVGVLEEDETRCPEAINSLEICEGAGGEVDLAAKRHDPEHLVEEDTDYLVPSREKRGGVYRPLWPPRRPPGAE